jgi:hypothetical protein
MACAALLLVSVEAATTLGQPFVKRCAFHDFLLFPTPTRVFLFGAPVKGRLHTLSQMVVITKP